MAQEIYHRSEWGNPNEQWGNVYLNADLTNELYKRASEYENSWVTDQILNGVGTKPSIILTPTAYEDGVLNSVKPAKPYSDEITVNGNFDTDSDWTKDAGWTISNGEAIHTGSGSYISQTGTTIGKNYRVVIEVTQASGSGFPQIYMGGLTTAMTSVGTYTFDITATTTFIRLRGINDCKVTSISVKEVLHADFDFTRGSSATRVNEKGLVQDVQLLSGELVQNGNFEQIGSEQIVNGDFSDSSWWGLDPVWSISNGSANCNGSGVIYKGGVLTIGKTYKVEVEISSYTSGTLTYPNAPYSLPSAVGSYTFYYKANSQTVSFTGTNFIGSIDNVSVKEVGQNWIFGTGWSMGDGVAIHTGTQSLLSQENILTIGNIYKISFDLTGADNFNYARLITSQYPNGGSYQTDGTHVIYTSTTISHLYIYGVGDITIDNISVIEITDDTDLPRINYTNFDYENGVAVPYSGEGSLLLEPQATNLITNSESYSGWSKDASVSVTSTDNTSPTNESNASKITVTDSGRLYYDPTIPTTADRVTSVFLKGGSFVNFKLTCISSSQIDLSAETASNGFGIEKLNDGWFRISTTAQSVTPTSRRIQIQAYPDNTYTNGHGETGTYYVFGTQMEDTQLTSYIPTNGSTVTRLADVCNNSGSSDLINSTEGVLYFEGSALADDGVDKRIFLSDGTMNNYVATGYSRFSGNIISEMYSGGVLQTINWGATGVTQTNNNKFALSWGSGTMKFYVNGTQTNTESVTSPIGLNVLEFNTAVDTLFMEANVKCLAVFKEALSDTELQKLTT
jgi:hypothetical protein